ncbi:hypothetical protein BLA29_005562, partial [Euroglyphus maynei]
VEKTPEGDEKKKFVLEFKKKIQNLTSLNTIIDDKEPVNAPEVEEEIDDENEEEKVLVKREIKQIFLDPVKQPSIVIRAKRSAISINDTSDAGETNTNNPLFEMTTLPTQVFDENDTLLNETDDMKKNGTYEKCRLLIRFKANPENVTEELSDSGSEVDKNQTLLEPIEELKSSSENEESVVEKTEEMKSNEKKSDHVQKENEPEKIPSIELDKKAKVEEKPLKIPEDSEETSTEIIAAPEANKEEKSIIDVTSTPLPTKEEKSPKQTPILTIADDEKLAQTKEESTSPTSISSAKEPQKVETPVISTAEKVEETKGVDKIPETSSISTVKVSTTIEPSKTETTSEKPKKSSPTDLELGLLINVRKFVDGIFETFETDVNRSITRKKEAKKMNPFWKNK